jgi:hypothetical protein
VCGIVDSDTKYDMLEINFEHGKGKVKGRLSFTLIDKNQESIAVNLWGELSKLDIFEGDLVVINGARVSNFGGKSLNCGQEHCKILVNPNFETVNDLDEFVNLTRC